MAERPNLSKRGTPAATPSATPGSKPPPPRFVLIAVAAMALSGIAAVLASLTLFIGSVQVSLRDGARDTLADQMHDKYDDIRKAGPTSGEQGTRLTELRNEINKIKPTPSDQLSSVGKTIKSDIAALKPGASKKGKDLLAELDKQATSVRDIRDQSATQQKGVLLSSVVVLIALGVAAAAAYRGRYWARWATLGLWVLATFTGTLAGLGSVMSVGADIPALFKVPAFVAGAALIVAVVLTNLRPSVEYFNHGRPDRTAGRPARRGLFAPPARPAATDPEPAAATARPARADDRARTKARSSDAAVAKGADLARSRAKASKSRRSGT